MTDIRELLSHVADDVGSTETDPVGRVRRASIRRRRRVLATTVAIAAAIAAAIVVPLTESTGGATSVTTLPAPTPTPTALPSVAGLSTLPEGTPLDCSWALGFGELWGIPDCGGQTGSVTIDRVSPGSGAAVGHVTVAGPAAHIAAGAGRVWTIGATDGGMSAINAINPATGQVAKLRLGDPRAEPDGIAFANGDAWVTFRLLNQVWQLTPTADGFTKAVIDVPGGPSSIATTGGGALWVQEGDANRLAHIDATTLTVGPTVDWSGAVYGPAGADMIWAYDGDRLIQLIPSALSGCVSCAEIDRVPVTGTIEAVLSGGHGSVFVATDKGVYYYDADAAGGSRGATASLNYPDVDSLMPYGDGVEFGGPNDPVLRWNPPS